MTDVFWVDATSIPGLSRSGAGVYISDGGADPVGFPGVLKILTSGSLSPGVFAFFGFFFWVDGV